MNIKGLLIASFIYFVLSFVAIKLDLYDGIVLYLLCMISYGKLEGK